MASMKKKTAGASDWRVIALAGYAIIVLTFGVGGGWAAVAKLDRAVIATGYVATETNRKTVQHYEGGIIREILVKEGDRVTEGQVLFRLQKVQAEATSDTVRNQLDSALALEARLIAERDQKDNIVWPREFEGRTQDSVLSRTLADQVHEFEERRASLEGQIKLLESRVEQTTTEIQGIDTEKDSTEKQLSYIANELVGLRELSAKQLIAVSRIYAMEREQSRLEGEIGRLTADRAKAESSIGEMKLQMQQTRQKFQEDVGASLLDARQKSSDLRERVAVAGDVLNRVEIKAPRSGTIQNLKVFTDGQVVRSGEALLDLVPDDEPLVVDGQFLPTDIDNVHAGMQAEIRFPSFHSRTVPVMLGTLGTISNDRMMDDNTHQYYFRGVISLNRADIPEEYRSRVRPGMPAEIIVAVGSRTVLSYIVSPLTNSLRKAFREPND
jgi:membrane fusion protein, type I secretion system